MRYTLVTSDADGGSRFEDVDVDQVETPFAANVLPLMVSTPVPAAAVVFVDTPPEVRDTDPHPAPRRQFIVPLAGEAEIETTDGERRRFRPGMVLLVEDTEGAGHITTVISEGPLSFLAIPLA